MIDLEKKVVLISGAGRGCGRILSEAFAERGAHVAANDISPLNVDEVINIIVKRGGSAKAYIEDVAKKVGVQHVIKQVEDDFGQIDILINHAAVEPRVPLLDMDEWDWHRVLDVNLTGAFLMTQSVGRVMRARGKGVIINLIPVAQASDRREAGAAFIASMSGLEGFTRQAARELRPYGIHVHAVESRAEQIVDKVLALLANEEEI